MSDRYCIHLNKTVHLSTEDLLSCCTTCGKGYIIIDIAFLFLYYFIAAREVFLELLGKKFYLHETTMKVFETGLIGFTMELSLVGNTIQVKAVGHTA